MPSRLEQQPSDSSSAASSIWSDRCRLSNASSGPLAGERFAIKDLIAVQGLVRGEGNPHWRQLQEPAPAHAPCVARLLEAGAEALGTTQLDEFAFGLTGENPWSGTPPNPRAPGRLPGGSSSGSAAAVAGGWVELALGTDTGGSVRVPSSWCGLWGWRPSHGLLPLEGVAPLAPSLDVVGLFSGNPERLRRAAGVLTGAAPGPASSPDGLSGRAAAAIPLPARLFWIPELWQLAAEAERQALHSAALQLADRLHLPLIALGLADLGLAGSAELLDCFQAIQWHEVEHSLARLPADLPQGPVLRRNRQRLAERDRTRLEPARRLRRQLSQRLQQLLAAPGPTGARVAVASPTGVEREPAPRCGGLLLLPVTPCVAPPVGSLSLERDSGSLLGKVLTLNALAGLAGLPELSAPLASLDSLPLGLGLLGGRHADQQLLHLPLSWAPGQRA